MTRLALPALLLALTLGAPVALAAEPTPELSEDQLREASEIFGDTWSPFCPGRTLASCTSGKAAEWRNEIRGWLAEGLTREQVLDRLRARLPEDFQLDTVPDTEGMRYGPWILGGLFLTILAGLGVFHARRSVGVEGGEASPVPETAPTVDRKALDRELEALDD